ncbi:hypothetical protein TRVL_04151 [Trypanosoma vivax]|nr:hypothetical protein TRVL_04151 [Trypanosoma vivax]
MPACRGVDAAANTLHNGIEHLPFTRAGRRATRMFAQGLHRQRSNTRSRCIQCERFVEKAGLHLSRIRLQMSLVAAAQPCRTGASARTVGSMLYSTLSMRKKNWVYAAVTALPPLALVSRPPCAARTPMLHRWLRCDPLSSVDGRPATVTATETLSERNATGPYRRERDPRKAGDSGISRDRTASV